MERELDSLIDNLSSTLHSPSPGHRSRYYEHTEHRKETTYTRSNPHRDYLYNKYGKFGGTPSPRMPKRSTMEEGWYKAISKDMGTPRSPTPILKRRGADGLRSPSNSRPTSQVSWRSSSESLRETTPEYIVNSYSRPISPILKGTFPARNRSMSPSRSYSPKQHQQQNRSVVIGPVTDMVTKEHQAAGKQEYFRHRDAHQGKPIGGRHGFMTYSWPYGLDLIGDAYLNSKRKPPAESPPEAKIPSPPIYRRARSVEPPIRRTPERDLLNSDNLYGSSTELPDYMRRLRHIVVEQVPVPIPPKFGTLTHGGRSPNSAMGPVDGGPPCNLCHKPITEGRCIFAENAQYHCWHFVCSFCFVTLRSHNFVMAEDNKPYCLNCFKRSYP